VKSHVGSPRIDPEVFMMDDAFAALDAQTRETLQAAHHALKVSATPCDVRQA
jgi:ABC-type nitrate/sulfonate/bicarbonate transport system ATPase subunit